MTGFFAKNHSWSIIQQNLATTLIDLGHKVDIFSTNGLKFFPNHLKNNVIDYVEESVDGSELLKKYLELNKSNFNVPKRMPFLNNFLYLSLLL